MLSTWQKVGHIRDKPLVILSELLVNDNTAVYNCTCFGSQIFGLSGATNADWLLQILACIKCVERGCLCQSWVGPVHARQPRQICPLFNDRHLPLRGRKDRQGVKKRGWINGRCTTWAHTQEQTERQTDRIPMSVPSRSAYGLALLFLTRD